MAIKRVTADFSESAFNVLSELAERGDITKAEVLRKAISLLKYLEDEVASGHKIILEDNKQGTKKELAFL